MADCYRPGEAQNSRKNSQPNHDWRRQPPTGPRSYTMAPRITSPALDPRKRPPSQSPEGVHVRKQVRPDPPSDIPPPQQSKITSRRSSASGSAPSAQPSNEATIPDSPRPADALSKKLSRVNRESPSHSLSARNNINGGTSGRSTPIRRGSTTTTIEAEVSDVAMTDNVTEQGATVLDFLVKFSSAVATQTSLQITRDQAQSRHERAQLEYNENRQQFDSYPAIKECKSSKKAATQRDLDIKSTRLEEQKASHARNMAGLAELIEQARANSIASASRTDLVSRADHEELAAKTNALKLDADATKANFKNLREDVSETRRIAHNATAVSGQVAVLQGKIAKLENSTDALDKRVHRSEGLLARMDDLEKDTKWAHDKANTLRAQVQAFPNIELKKLATKESVEEIKSTITQEINGLQKRTADMSKDVGQMKADKIASGFAKPPANSASAIDDDYLKKPVETLNKGVMLLLKLVPELKREVQSFGGVVTGEDSASTDYAKYLDSRSLPALHSDLKEQLKLFTTKANITARVLNEPESPLMTRVKTLENALVAQSEQGKSDHKSSLGHRLSELERALRAMRNDLTALRVSGQPTGSATPDPLAPTNSEDHDERLKGIDDAIASLKREADERDEMVFADLEAKFADITAQLTRLVESQTNVEQSNVTSLSQLKQDLANAMQAMTKKASSQDFASLQSKTATEMAELKSFTGNLRDWCEQLQNRQPTQVAAAASTSPVTNGVHSHPPNNPRGPLPANGVHSVLAQPNGPAVPIPVDHTAEINDLRSRTEGLNISITHLKQRCDNLTTDELARQMIDQMSNMYPAAKNFNASMHQVQSSYQQIDNRLQNMGRSFALLQKETNDAVAELKRLGSDLKTSVDDMRQTAEQGSSTAKDSRSAADLKADVDKVKTGVEHLTKLSSELESDLVTLRTDVDNGTAVAIAADKLSRQLNSRLNKTNLERMSERMFQLTDQVDEHEERIKELLSNWKNAKDRIAAMNDEVSNFEGRTEHVEEQIKKFHKKK